MRRRQLDEESAARLSKQIDERKEQKRRLRAISHSEDIQEPEIIDDGSLGNAHSFNEEIRFKGFQFHSVVLSNPVIGTCSLR